MTCDNRVTARVIESENTAQHKTTSRELLQLAADKRHMPCFGSWSWCWRTAQADHSANVCQDGCIMAWPGATSHAHQRMLHAMLV
eukprot:1493790-Amphidinium_carterae.2